MKNRHISTANFMSVAMIGTELDRSLFISVTSPADTSICGMHRQ